MAIWNIYILQFRFWHLGKKNRFGASYRNINKCIIYIKSINAYDEIEIKIDIADNIYRPSSIIVILTVVYAGIVYHTSYMHIYKLLILSYYIVVYI